MAIYGRVFGMDIYHPKDGCELKSVVLGRNASKKKAAGPLDAMDWSPVFPKMPIDAALEFADSGESTGGIMTHEALETLAAAYRDVLRILKDPVAVHINMLRGTIAWTPEHLRHVLGDSPQNDESIHPETKP